jgi:hypothetical protein
MAESAFTAADNFRKKAADIRADRRFSAEGHLERIRAEAKSSLGYFAELRKQIGAERASLAKRRAHFELPKHDRDDVVAELQRQEIRAWLRSIPNPGERIKHAARNPEIARAVVNSPAELSGLAGDGIERVKAFLLEHLHGPELATLRAEAEIVDNVAVAIDVAEKQALSEFEPEPKKVA